MVVCEQDVFWLPAPMILLPSGWYQPWWQGDYLCRLQRRARDGFSPSSVSCSPWRML